MKKLMATATLLILFPMLASAQSGPSADHLYRGDGYLFLGFGNGSNYGVNGISIGSAVVEHVGGGGELNLYQGLGLGAELGYAYWSGGAAGAAWTPSLDLLFHIRGNKTRGLVDAFVFGGTSAYIPTTYGVRGSPAGNFGGGVNLWFTKHTALRFEFRDYVTNNTYNLQPARNYASFRMGVTFR